MFKRLGRVVGCLVAALPAFGLGGVTPSTADIQCVGTARVFAVDGTSGHLVELRACQSSRVWTLAPAGEVDSADWRSYPAVFGVSDGDAAILYTVTATGELWWRRQDAPGAAMGAPVRIADDVHWLRAVVFAAGPGQLALGDYGTPVRLFRHDGWATGGTAVAEDGTLFTALHGPAVTALAPESGYAVGTWEGQNYRVWRDPSRPAHDDLWYPSGALPPGVNGATGNGTQLYGVLSGDVVLLTQRAWPCRPANHNDWQVAARAPGHYGRVVVPVGAGAATPPSVAAPPHVDPRLAPLCGSNIEFPWEWQ